MTTSLSRINLRSAAARAGLAGVVAVLLMLLAIWLMLAGSDLASLAIGVPSLLVAIVTWLAIGPGSGRAPSTLGTIRFLPRFARDSLLGACDVARRAFSPSRPPRGRCLRWPLALRHGEGRVLFINLVSLVPGTLSVHDDGESLVVHALDDGDAVEEALGELEQRVLGMYARREVSAHG